MSMQGRITRITRKATLIAAALLALAVPASAQACEGEAKAPPELGVKEAREAVLCLINERRRANGVGKLRDDARLERAAQKHSSSMDERNFFSHTSPSGSSPLSRIQNTGYMAGASSWGIAENIRWGSGRLGSAKAAVAAWMDSPAHRSAMLSGRYRQIGVGVALGSPTGGGEGNTAIYTTTFGYRS
jgi:uncharacterized protein YkwD